MGARMLTIDPPLASLAADARHSLDFSRILVDFP
jgi:hypothetical protein